MRSVEGRVALDAAWGPDPGDGLNWPPFRPFGEDYYSYQILLGLAVDPGWAVRIETHPKYYAGPSNSTPLEHPALDLNRM